MDSFMASNGWIMFHGHLDYFQEPLLGGRPNTKPGDRSTPNTHNCSFILFYHVWELVWLKTHSNSIWLRVRSHMTSHYTWGPVTTLHDFGGVLGGPLDAFLSSHNFMVMALGSCVKWPLLSNSETECIIYQMTCGVGDIMQATKSETTWSAEEQMSLFFSGWQWIQGIPQLNY